MPRVPPDANDEIVWKLDEPSAPFVNSGTLAPAHDLLTLSSATYTGLPNPRLQVEGPFGAGSFAVEFAGSQSSAPRSYISGANTYRPAAPVTWSGWIKLHQYDGAPNQQWFAKQHTTGTWSGSTFGSPVIQNRNFASQPEQWVGAFYKSGLVYVTAGPIDITQRIPIGVWNHIGMTYDAVDARMYLNGDLVWITAETSAILYNTTGTSGPYFFGAVPSGSGSPEEPFYSVADWRIANVARPKSYFENIYRQGQRTWTGRATLPNGGLTRYYKMKATCTTAASGYVEWVNTTADLAGVPACAGILGPPLIVATWEA